MRGSNGSNSSTSRLVVPGAKQAIDKMKYEIANEFGVNLGPDTASRDNGSVGGEITKRLVQMGESQLGGGYGSSSSSSSSSHGSQSQSR
jgi:small acid-soluble spore protein A (major alpha-type SASP)